MVESWQSRKRKINFRDNKGLEILLSYNLSLENKPSSKFVYWEKKKYRKIIMNFRARLYEKNKTEKYWKQILEND